MSELFESPATEQQSGLAFPQSLTEKYRPKTVDEFVGLDKAKRFFNRMAAHPFASAWLFLGSSGTGKTTFATALRDAIQAEEHHIPSQECNVENLERVRRICQYVPQAGCKMHMIHISEADQMTQAAQLKMLSYADHTNFPPNTIIILTANATDRLEPRFLSRFHTIEFSSYGMAKDVTALLERIWIAETGSIDNAPNFARIVKESNNNVRESIMRLETEILTA
jgi:replication-associated recombination protein RarA